MMCVVRNACLLLVCRCFEPIKRNDVVYSSELNISSLFAVNKLRSVTTVYRPSPEYCCLFSRANFDPWRQPFKIVTPFYLAAKRFQFSCGRLG